MDCAVGRQWCQSALRAKAWLSADATLTYGGDACLYKLTSKSKPSQLWSVSGALLPRTTGNCPPMRLEGKLPLNRHPLTSLWSVELFSKAHGVERRGAAKLQAWPASGALGMQLALLALVTDELPLRHVEFDVRTHCSGNRPSHLAGCGSVHDSSGPCHGRACAGSRGHVVQ